MGIRSCGRLASTWGIFGLGAGLAETIRSGLLIGLCITWRTPGWYVLAALFLLTGLAVPAAVRWTRSGQASEMDRGDPDQAGGQAPPPPSTRTRRCGTSSTPSARIAVNAIRSTATAVRRILLVAFDEENRDLVAAAVRIEADLQGEASHR
ncbi:hypothetical protein GCM10010112_90520 [Actinoplanes lobatus]|uniref:Uncharacterized protein n=1 Tax=Actinoplanes lobatus TaxID=113568 RepID=A0ABQ4AYB8_9ACTN|nr:hypothetical protein GCM10010112_90520 [Actinoplanes lobatus]GIE45810.1 hypothetical protein Alo02nite_87080 [Actinoplanes lobatus]